MLTNMEDVKAAQGQVINGVDNPNLMSVDSTEPIKTTVDAEKVAELSKEIVVAKADDKDKKVAEEKKDEKETTEGKTESAEEGQKEEKEVVPEKKADDKDSAKGEAKDVEEGDDAAAKQKAIEAMSVDDADLPKSVQRRFDKLTKIRRSQERELAYKEQQIQQLEERLARLEEGVSGKPVKNAADDDDEDMLNADFERPDRDDYDLEEEYIEALTDYKVKKVMAPQLKRLEDEEKEKRARQEIDAHFDGLDEVLADGEEKYEDFTKAVTGNFPLSKEAVYAILETDAPADILYYISQNRDVADRLAEMTERSMLRELGKIEQEVLSKETKPIKQPTAEKKAAVSKAPEPIRPIKTESVGHFDPNKASMKEYRKWRESQGG